MAHIVILTDQICKIGGITKLIQLKANYWVEIDKHRVTVITTEQRGLPPFYRLNPEVELIDLSVNYDRTKSYIRSLNIFKVIMNIFRLRRTIKKINVDIIIVANHIPVTFFFPLLTTSAKIIKEFHFSQYYRSKQKKTVFKKFESYLESQFDHLIVLNKEERKFYGANNVVHIPNPIELQSNGLLPPSQKRKVAIAAGRISEVKRFDKLIDIWSSFARINREWRLEIYGEGLHDYVSALKEKVRHNGLEDIIEIKPSTNDLRSVMKSSGLYLMTSAQECFPMVLLEAQSCGLPIIAYDCPTGPRNIITHELDGILVEFDNADSFVEELVRLTSDDSLRNKLALQGLQNGKKYSLERIMPEWDAKIIKS